MTCSTCPAVTVVSACPGNHPVSVQSLFVPTPTLGGVPSGSEGSLVFGLITNFDPLAVYSWVVPQSVQGSWSFDPACGAWSFTFPAASAGDTVTLQVTALRLGELTSESASLTVVRKTSAIQDGPTIIFQDSADGFPGANWTGGSMALVDAGAQSAGRNNAHQLVTAKPEFVLLNPRTFAAIGGTAANPTMQHDQIGMISAGDELWFKPVGGNTLTAVTVGGVSESGGGAEALIPQATGAVVGNAPYYGNSLSICFNGAVGARDAANCVEYEGASTSGYDMWVGKTYDAARRVTKAVIKSPTNEGFLGNDSATGVKVRGSNDGGATWTDLFTGTTSSGTALTDALTLSSTGNYTTYGVFLCGNGYNNPILAEVEFYETALPTYTLSNLTPAQGALPEQVFKLRNDPTKALMSLASGVTDQVFTSDDFATPVAMASVAYAPGPELTVTGPEITLANSPALKRLALRLRGDTALGCRAKAAKLYTEEMTS